MKQVPTHRQGIPELLEIASLDNDIILESAIWKALIN